jgi:hypothetical protein
MKLDIETTGMLLLVLIALAVNACGSTPHGRPKTDPNVTPAGLLLEPQPLPPEGPWWRNCAYPEEADEKAIDFAEVTIAVYVAADAIPQAATILHDPGYGFGRAAVQCLTRRRFTSAKDGLGNPRAGWTPPIRVRYDRRPLQ